jgi:hypothetical protein
VPYKSSNREGKMFWLSSQITLRCCLTIYFYHFAALCERRLSAVVTEVKLRAVLFLDDFGG